MKLFAQQLFTISLFFIGVVIVYFGITTLAPIVASKVEAIPRIAASASTVNGDVTKSVATRTADVAADTASMAKSEVLAQQAQAEAEAKASDIQEDTDTMSAMLQSVNSPSEAPEHETAEPEEAVETEEAVTETDEAPATEESEAAEDAQAAETTSAEQESLAAPELAPRTIVVNGKAVSYTDSYVSSSAPEHGAGLWMGSDSTVDGTWSYFIGHDPGDFTPVMDLGNGDPVTVCDQNGNSLTYYVVDSFIVPDSATWQDIEVRVTGYGESTILQTCCGDNATYRVVVAANLAA